MCRFNQETAKSGDIIDRKQKGPYPLSTCDDLISVPGFPVAWTTADISLKLKSQTNTGSFCFIISRIEVVLRKTPLVVERDSDSGLVQGLQTCVA